MKRYVSVFLVIVMAFSFCACAKNINKKDESTTQASVFYDRNGVKYTKAEDVKYYDADGNVYNKILDEDGLPNFVDVNTGNSYFGMLCYISEDGYLYVDESNELNRVKGTVDTYQDVLGKKYYDISTVYWDSSGNLTHWK